MRQRPNTSPKPPARVFLAVRAVRFLRRIGVLSVFARLKVRLHRPPPGPSPRFTLAVCAVIGDDGPFLREWLEFHRLVGVEHFFLYHSDPGEQTLQILAEYSNAGEATVARRPGTAGSAADTFNHFLRSHGREAEWIAFLEGDDFLFGTDEDDLRIVLRDYREWPGVRAVGAYTFGPRTVINTRFLPVRAISVFAFVLPLGFGLWTSIPCSVAKKGHGGASRMRANRYPLKSVIPRFSNSYLDFFISRFSATLCTRLDLAPQSVPRAQVNEAAIRTYRQNGNQGIPAGRAPLAPREIVVLGMARSGNHAVIEWLLSGAGRSWVFANDLNVGQDPFQPAGLVHRSRGEEPRLAVYSHEDFDPATVGDRVPGGAHVLVLRDPYNLLASRLRAHSINPDAVGMPSTRDAARMVMERWILHALEFIGQTHHLPNRFNVNFASFIGDSNYRRDLAAGLRIEPDDSTLKRVATYGRGSSFDRMRYDGKADRMRVLDRWREYAGDPVFQDAVRDPRIRQLAELIFPGLSSPV